MRSFFFITLFLSQNLVAEEQWVVGATTYKLHRLESGALVNKICVTNPNCLALKAAQNKMAFKILSGGKNPGSTACKENKGHVFIAQRGESTQGFCRFDDHSFISLNGFFP